MILGVAAAVYAFERREIIRQTWGTYANTEDVKLLFFVGDNGDANVNEHLIKGKTSSLCLGWVKFPKSLGSGGPVSQSKASIFNVSQS